MLARVSDPNTTWIRVLETTQMKDAFFGQARSFQPREAKRTPKICALNQERI
jgi:hypothetical protein